MTRAIYPARERGREGEERAERDSAEKARNRDREQQTRPTGALDTANKRRMRVNRVKQTRAALGNNEVTRSVEARRELVYTYTRRLLHGRITREIIPREPSRWDALSGDIAFSRPFAFSGNQRNQIR